MCDGRRYDSPCDDECARPTFIVRSRPWSCKEVMADRYQSDLSVLGRASGLGATANKRAVLQGTRICQDPFCA